MFDPFRCFRYQRGARPLFGLNGENFRLPGLVGHAAQRERDVKIYFIPLH